MKKKLLATVALLGLMAAPAFADTQVLTFSKNGKTIVITIEYKDLNLNHQLDFSELRTITSIVVTVQ
jgi:opacity protein-like surface antigen